MEFLDLEMLEFVSIGQALLYTCLFIVADALAGILLALKMGEFDFARVFEFLKTSVLPYIGGLLIGAGVAYGAPVTEAIFLAFAAGVALKYLYELYGKLAEIVRKNDDPA